MPSDAAVVVEPAPEPAAMVPVTDAVKVWIAVVCKMTPVPIAVAAQAGISVQNGPPQTKDSIPQQSRGTTNVSPATRALRSGLTLARQVALRKVSVAT